MNINDIREYAEENDILLIDGKLKSDVPSMSIMDADRNCAVIIDQKKIKTNAEELVMTAHEVGHCETGAFYNKHILDLRSRCEYRADKWAIKKLIPKDELISAFENGIMEIWELAEYFGVTEEFMIQACEFYGYYHKAI